MTPRGALGSTDRGGLLVTFLRHQAGALLATGVDFAVMIACVRFARWSPEAGTALGAACGAVTNFLLGRRWVFRATGGRAHIQAVRYAAIAFGSMGLNVLGEYVVHVMLGVQYVVARIFVSIIISVGWNFQMHRHYVFRA